MWIELFSIMIELKQWEHCLQSETIRTGMTYLLDDFNKLYKTKNIWRFSLFKLKIKIWQINKEKFRAKRERWNSGVVTVEQPLQDGVAQGAVHSLCGKKYSQGT